MSKIAKAAYRIPGEKMKFWCGEEKVITEIENSSTSYVISNFDASELISISGNESISKPDFSLTLHNKTILEESTKKLDYLELIRKIQTSISNQELSKVVAARCKVIELPANFDINHFIENLCEQLPSAYISVYQGEKGTFIAASPELLLEKDKSGKASTVAIAGTSKWENRGELGAKENEEQDYIVQHIRGLLANYGSNILETKKQILKAGPLAHLMSKFDFELEENKLNSFLKALHPTPAVGGFPSKPSLDFIKHNESFDRGFYAGFSGMVSNKKINLSVNLRCIQIIGNKAILYAGAGITKDSNPEKEWLETEEKMKVLGLSSPPDPI